jgi:hypothetical protein
MTNVPFTQPLFFEDAFNCPLCHAYSKMTWSKLRTDSNYYVTECHVCYCSCCGGFSVWKNEEMIYPAIIEVPDPNNDMPSDIKSDYIEAATIVRSSPRGAAAILRLAIQKICISLGGKGANLNDDIGNLVKNGLPPKVQQSLDSLRVIGNEAVHPGELDLKDDHETAAALFRLTNFIVEKMISEPNEIEGLYISKIPKSKKEQIVKRDSN